MSLAARNQTTMKSVLKKVLSWKTSKKYFWKIKWKSRAAQKCFQLWEIYVAQFKLIPFSISLSFFPAWNIFCSESFKARKKSETQTQVTNFFIVKLLKIHSLPFSKIWGIQNEPAMLHLKFKMVVKDDEFLSLSFTFNILLVLASVAGKRCAIALRQ